MPIHSWGTCSMMVDTRMCQSSVEAAAWRLHSVKAAGKGRSVGRP